MAISVFKKSTPAPEPFIADKLKKTVYAACLNVRSPEDSATSTAEIVCKEVEKWLEQKEEITTLDIKEKTTEILQKYHPEAAYLYNQYNVTI